MNRPSAEGSRMSRFLGHVEDVCLSVGALLASIGIGLAYGLALGLIAFGLLLVSYGVWITERSR